MEILILTDIGCEDAAATEAARLIGARCATQQGAVALTGTLEDACALAYRSCVARRIILPIHAPVRDPDGLGAPDVPAGFTDGTFKAEADSTIGEAQELTERVGGWFQRATGRKVSLGAPDTVVVAHQTAERLVVGVDVSGPLEKREWRIMLSNRSLKATVAASAAIYAGLAPGERILDPLGDDGTLAIEAALTLTGASPRQHAKRYPWQRHIQGWDAWKAAQDGSRRDAHITVYCDSLREMKAVRMHSKLAGMTAHVQSTRVQLDWADLKLEEASLDRILTHVWQSGKALPEKKALQRIDDLFNQAAYLLTKKGTITCITGKPEELHPAKRHGFRKKEERLVMMGRMPVTIITFAR